jgi:hypothetical protein
MRILASAILAVFLSSVIASACTCIDTPTPPCERLRAYRGAVLFLGQVKSIRTERIFLEPDNYPIKQQVVTFTVQESFAGNVGGEVVIKDSVPGNGSCGFPFQSRAVYLVDARFSNDNQLHNSSCGFTSSRADASDTLGFLRTLTRNPVGAIIFGTVKQYVGQRNFVSPLNRAVEGAEVTVDALPDVLAPVHQNRRVFVDSSGWYEFVGLDAGQYTVHVTLPAGFSEVRDQDFRLDSNSCSQLDFRTESISTPAQTQ